MVKKTVLMINIPGGRPEDQILKKHKEYYRAAKKYRTLYYATRIIAGLFAGILPFVIRTRPNVATGLSIGIVIATLIDNIWRPKERWKYLSRATDLLYVAQLKKNGKYEEFKEQLEIIMSTEDHEMLELLEIDDVMKNIHKMNDTQNSNDE